MSAPKTILVVEDEPELSLAMKIRLTDAGFNVITAQDALEATTSTQRNHPDLIIMDFGLPAGSGGDVFQRLTTALGASGVPPIIFLSAFPRERVMEAIPPSDKIRFMQKPAQFDEVARTIRLMLKMPAPADSAAKGKPQVDLDLDG